MTPGELAAIVGGLFAILFAIAAYLWKRMDARIDKYIEDHSILAQFKAFDAERERNWMIWRTSMDRCVERLSSLPIRTEQTEHFIEELRYWKHNRGEPHVMAMIALEKRVERIERHLNGHLK
jgi:hypothetical protein